jgi:inorganic pyrophosphatase/exopolyphosphatase
MTKYTTEEFADQIRCKYPNAYDDLDDETLIQLWLKKFPNDEEKIAIANELTTQLNENKNNIAKMNETQTIAIEKLGITF